MIDPSTGRQIATGFAAAPFFARGTLWAKWWYQHGHRIATPAEQHEEAAAVKAWTGTRAYDPHRSLDVRTPGAWRGHTVQQPKIGGKK